MCDAAMRPMYPVNEYEVRCEEEDGHFLVTGHRGTIRGFNPDGKETALVWMEDDRRNFHGEWPGRCGESFSGDQCVLPHGHRGNHAT